MEVKSVAIGKISEHPLNVRMFRSQEDIERIAKSIKEKGFEYPIKVVLGKNNGYLCYDGGYRLEAAKILGLTKVPIIIETVQSDSELVLKSFDIGDKHVPLNPLEEANAFSYLIKTHSIGQIAKKIQRKPTYIKQRLTLSQLVSRAKKKVLMGWMQWLAAYRLARKPKEIQEKVMDYVEKDRFHSVSIWHIDEYIARAEGRRVKRVNTSSGHSIETRTDIDWTCPKCNARYQTYCTEYGHSFERKQAKEAR